MGQSPIFNNGQVASSTLLLIILRPMSYLQFYRAILSSNFFARQNRNYDMPCRTLQLCRMNDNRPNQRSPHFRDKVAQNRALL